MEWIDHALPRTFFVRNESIAKTTGSINANPGRIRPSVVLDHLISLGHLMSRRSSGVVGEPLPGPMTLEPPETLNPLPALAANGELDTKLTSRHSYFKISFSIRAVIVTRMHGAATDMGNTSDRREATETLMPSRRARCIWVELILAIMECGMKRRLHKRSYQVKIDVIK
jgi:hypothetical protein